MSISVENGKGTVLAVCEAIKCDITKGRLKPGAKLAPLRTLAKKYDVSYLTVQRAMSKLSNEGVVKSRQGAGVFLNGIKSSNSTSADAPKKRTGNVAMLFVGLKHYMVNSPIYSQVFHGVETEARQQGMNLIISQVSDASSVPSKVIDGETDGVLLLGSSGMAGLEEKLAGIPSVWMMGDEKLWGDHITYDNNMIGVVAANHLVGKGHKTLVCMNVMPEYGKSRRFSFCETAEGAKAKVTSYSNTDAYVVSDDEQHVDSDIVYGWIDEVVKLTPRPTAIFADTDLLVPVIHNRLYQKGIEPGKDIEIIGCNCERRLTMGLIPKPGSVDIGAEQIGKMAVRQLLWRKENPDDIRMITRLEPSVITG